MFRRLYKRVFPYSAADCGVPGLSKGEPMAEAETTKQQRIEEIIQEALVFCADYGNSIDVEELAKRILEEIEDGA